MSFLYRLSGIRFSYPGKLQALSIPELNIEQGSRIALIGANGSGKSTLLKLLDGLYFPQEGTIEFNGESITEKRLQEDEFCYAFRKRVGLLFQDPEVQLFSPTVYDEICFAPLQLGFEREKILEEAERVLSQFELRKLKDRPPFHLSLGEKKKVALASVLIADPQVLLLDEPTASLDPRTQSLLLELLHQWQKGDRTIITSTHDLTILREICDSVYVLQNGEIVNHDSPENVLQNEALLDKTNLIHVHTHRHPQVEHAHPHTHDFHAHSHEDES